MKLQLLVLFVAIEIIAMAVTHVQCHSRHRHRHCSEPEEFPDIDGHDYNNITNLQLGSLLFGRIDGEPVQNPSIVRQELYVAPAEESLGGSAGSAFVAEVCRSRYVLNTDHTRKPNTLLERGCYTETASVHGQLYVCTPMMMYVNVLRRGACVHGSWTYERKWEPLSVACLATNPDSPIHLIRPGPFSEE